MRCTANRKKKHLVLTELTILGDVVKFNMQHFPDVHALRAREARGVLILIRQSSDCNPEIDETAVILAD